MIDIESICMMYRRAHTDRKIFSKIAEVHGLRVPQVKEILTERRLLSPEGDYIAPVRLTGKEKNMARKIDYPAFQWSRKRQKILAEMYQAEKPVSEIATHFGVEEEIIYKGIDKYNITRTYKAGRPDPAPAVIQPTVNYSGSLDEMKQALQQCNSLRIIPAEPTVCLRPQLEELLHLIVEANNHNNDAMGQFLTPGEGSSMEQGYFELGQQCAKLVQAERQIKRLLTLLPEKEGVSSDM